MKHFEYVDIVFAAVEDTPDLTFVEVESPPGHGVSVGQWIKRDDGLMALRLTGRIDVTEPEGALGAMGRFPEGKLVPEDKGEVSFAVGHHNGKVIVNFGEVVTWMGMTPNQARHLAMVLRTHADAVEKERTDGT